MELRVTVTVTIAIAHTDGYTNAGATDTYTDGYAYTGATNVHTNTHAITTDTPTLEPSPQSQSWIENRGQHQATLRAQTKTGGAREASTVLARFREQLPRLSAPYIANAQAHGYQARLSWISRRQVALEGILAGDAEPAAREVVALWTGILAEEKQREAEQEALRRAALEPIWKRVTFPIVCPQKPGFTLDAMVPKASDSVPLAS